MVPENSAPDDSLYANKLTGRQHETVNSLSANNGDNHGQQAGPQGARRNTPIALSRYDSGAALVGSNPGGGEFEGVAEGFFVLGITEPLWGSSKEGKMREYELTFIMLHVTRGCAGPRCHGTKPVASCS